MCDRDRDTNCSIKIECGKSARKYLKINNIDGVCNDECVRQQGGMINLNTLRGIDVMTARWAGGISLGVRSALMIG